MTPCGLSPLITCSIVPSLPAASIAWSTTSSDRRPSAYRRSWRSARRARSVSRSFSASPFFRPALSAGSQASRSKPFGGTRKRCFEIHRYQPLVPGAPLNGPVDVGGDPAAVEVALLRADDARRRAGTRPCGWGRRRRGRAAPRRRAPARGRSTPPRSRRARRRGRRGRWPCPSTRTACAARGGRAPARRRRCRRAARRAPAGGSSRARGRPRVESAIVDAAEAHAHAPGRALQARRSRVVPDALHGSGAVCAIIHGREYDPGAQQRRTQGAGPRRARERGGGRRREGRAQPPDRAPAGRPGRGRGGRGDRDRGELQRRQQGLGLQAHVGRQVRERRRHRGAGGHRRRSPASRRRASTSARATRRCAPCRSSTCSAPTAASSSSRSCRRSSRSTCGPASCGWSCARCRSSAPTP